MNFSRIKLSGRFAAAVSMVCFAVAASAQSMATSGHFEVSDAGTATYEVPLTLPPNTGGLQAPMSLVYRSVDGNGLFGVGWSLKGLSAITRCPKNPAEDGVRRGVQNTSADLFCLDGQKLRLKGGTYGGNGATYSTARESYARITSYGVAGDGPQWFKAELKDGRILEFGNTADSRLEVESGATVRTWMLSSISDRSTTGNRVRHSYAKDLSLGEQILTEVQYANGYVSMEYEARPADDPIVRYDAGMQHGSTNRRVKAIRIYSEPLVNNAPTRTLFKVYRLGYAQSAATRRSLLTTIQECSGDGTSAACLPALTLAYEKTMVSDLHLVSRSAPVGAADKYLPIDFRGNGKLDVLRPEIMSLGCCAGYQVASAQVWDFNSDGRMDVEVLLERYNMESVRRVLISDGQTLGGGGRIEPPGLYGCRGDFDGDGATDAIRFSGNEYAPALSLDSWAGGVMASRPFSTTSDVNTFIAYPCIPGDFTGEGNAEAVTFLGDSSTLSVHTFEPQSGGLRMVHLFSIPAKDFEVGDFNGDGKSDIISRVFASTMYLSNGRTMISRPLSGINIGGNKYTAARSSCAGDFNGDGRTDLYDFSTREFVLSTSTDFVRVPSGVPSGAHSSQEFAHCVDFSGNGRAEVYFPTRGQIWGAATSGPVDYLSEIVTGVGQRVRISYKPLTDDAMYTKGSGSIHPIIELQLPKHVVSRVQTSDGRGGFVPVSYSYEALRTDVRRNGALGFSLVRTLNEVSGVGVETRYRQDYPYVGLRASQRKFTGQRTLVDEAFNYQAFDQTAQYARVHVTSIDTRSFDLDGSFLSRSRENFSDMDGYGNTRVRTIEHLDELGSSVVSRQTTTHGYSNDATRWLIGLLTSATTTSQVSSGSIPANLGTPEAPSGPDSQPPHAATLTAPSFPNTQLGQSSTASAKLRNTGTQALLLSVPTSSSVPASDFRFVSTNCGSSLSVGSECDIAITFSPTASGTRSGSVMVSTSAGTRTASLSATSVPPQSIAVLTSPAAQTLPTVYLGGASHSVTFTYRNDGNANMTLTTPALASPLSVSSNGCSNVVPGATCNIVVTRATNVAGINQSQSFTPAGATSPPGAATVTWSVYVVVGRWSSTSLSFPNTVAGSSSALGVTLHNDGNVAVNWAANSGVANLPTGYSFNTSACANVASGGSCPVTVTFTPPTAGSFGGSGIRMIELNTAANTLSVSGQGTAPPLASFSPVSGTTLTASSPSPLCKEPRQYSDANVTVTNTGGGTLTITASSSSTYLGLSYSCTSATAGQSCNVRIRRYGNTSGATVAITTNGGSATYPVNGYYGAAPPSNCIPN